VALLILGLCLSAGTHAGAQPDQIQRLSGDLTPVGAERAGNQSGSIPAWDGGVTELPAGFTRGDLHPDPFGNDKVLFSIRHSNSAAFSGQMTNGQMAMFDRYPDSYRLDIYPSRRSASFPERIYQQTADNGLAGQLTADGEGVLNVAGGFPFPFPENGRELMWNHKLKFKSTGSQRKLNVITPTRSGQYDVLRLQIEVLSLYHTEGATLESIDNRLLYLLQEITSPVRRAGTLLLVHESVNETAQPRNVWTYSPAQRRVIRAPNVAYDNPSSATDGLIVTDMTDMFNGAMDRFDWSLVEKREIYVPYNAYQLHRSDADYDELVQAGHLNPDWLRYELHRVWVVEANLREGFRHINPRRIYYIDEDSYQIVLADHFDKNGRVWRYSEAHPINFYEVPTVWTTLETHHDLQTGRYASYRLDTSQGVPRFDLELSPSAFTPQALRRRARR
jgi:hypothetical protein